MHTHIASTPQNEKTTTRFIELDILRGIAIIFMIFLHILWDLDYFGILPLNNKIYQFQVLVPAMFFLLVGMCLAVSRNRTLTKPSVIENQYNKHLFIRGIKIFSLGILFTIITVIFMPERPIIFGVLHCIGFSIILSIPFLKLKTYNLLFATVFIGVGLLIGQIAIQNPSILQLVIGLHPTNIGQYTIDYFPVLPWFGVTLLGIAFGNIMYKDNKRRFQLPDLSKYKPFTIFSWLGKHSLAIYLFHQPIIAGALTLFLIL